MTRPVSRQPLWFLILFALAVSGGSVAYVPLLTVLLPLKVAGLMGGEDVGALARVTFIGAMIASISNIVFGILSDKTGNRIGWILAGLVISSVLLVAIGQAREIAHVIMLVMAWQIGLNMMLAPLIAWAGDCFPDEQKGMLGGLLALAPAIGALAGSLVTWDSLVAPAFRLPAVALIVAGLVLPAVVLGARQSRRELMQPIHAIENTAPDPFRNRSTAIRLWIARFLVQISEAGLFAFMLFWLRSVVPGFHENAAANIFTLILFAAVPIALWLGRWSDRKGRPIAPLVATAVLSAAGLAIMALSDGIELALAGYVVFGVSSTVFLSLHTGQTLRVLPKPQHRGRDLGIFNLTNTLPSIAMPWLTLSLVPSFGYSALFGLFGILILLAAAILWTVAKRARDT